MSSKRSRVSADDTNVVDKFMDTLQHPLKAEVQVVRAMIKGASKDITEEIKWNAPTFRYGGEYLVTFNLAAKEHIHLVFHNPQIANVRSILLEGNYPDRRMAYFANMSAIEEKRSMLEKAIKDLIKLQKK